MNVQALANHVTEIEQFPLGGISTALRKQPYFPLGMVIDYKQSP